MCRLFGFRSALDSSVHHSLIEAENALIDQSQKHSEGWGVAYFLHNAPHIIKSTEAAFDDRIFKRVSGVVSAKTVLAHLRLATVGSKSILNSHPFQYGPWVFAHNGNFSNFSRHRETLLNRIDVHMRRFILGETDSEVFFFILMTFLNESELLHNTTSIESLIDACSKALKFITSVIGPYSREDAEPERTYLSFILTNGAVMLAFHGGKTLHYSTYKTNCPSKSECPLYHISCEAPIEQGTVRHLIVSSEPLAGVNIWQKLKPGEIVAVNNEMNFVKTLCS